MMSTDLIITTYNRPDALEVVLISLLDQTIKPVQVIIADDGSEADTRELIEKYQDILCIRLIHSWHEDLGFRAAESRNRALALVKSEYVIVIDGDMLLHKYFIEDHLHAAQKGFFIQGGRVLLTQEKTETILDNPHQRFRLNPFTSGIESRLEKKLTAFRSVFLAKVLERELYNKSKVRSCNMSFYFEDVLSVNGFNNKFVGWGREDSEFVERLINRGLKGKLVKFTALGYHLYHREEPRSSLPENDRLLQDTIENGLVWCENGLSKFLK